MDSTNPVAHPLATPGRVSIPHWVWITALAWAVVMSAVVATRTLALATSFDLAFMVHGLGALFDGGFGAPVPFAGWSFAEDHFSPLAFPLAPLAASGAGPVGLLVVQVLAVAASIPIVWRAADVASASPSTARLVLAAYITAPSLMFAVWNDFHSSILAVPFLALAVDGTVRGRRWPFVVGLAGAALAREDMAVTAVLIAMAAVELPRRWRLEGGVVPLISLVAWRVTRGGPAPFLEASYPYLDADGLGAAVSGAAAAVWADGQFAFFGLLIGIPWIFFGRIAWRPVVVAVLAHAPYLASGFYNTKSVASHYYLAWPILGVWAVLAARNAGRRPEVVVAGIVVSIVIGPLGLGLALPTADTAPQVVERYLADRVAFDESRAFVESTVRRCATADSVSATKEVLPYVRHPHVEMFPSPFRAIVMASGVERDMVLDRTGPPHPDLVIVVAGRDVQGVLPTDYVELDGPKHVRAFVRSGFSGCTT